MQSCLICDDHALVREALGASVTQRWPTARVDLAGTFPEAWQRATLLPEVMLVDLVMPGANERQGIAGLRKAAPNTPLIVVTGSHDDAILLDLLADGVAGFVQKTSGSDIIMAAIDLALAGGRYLPPRVAQLASGIRTEPPAAGRGMVTPRQAEVLRLIAEGCSNKEIARHLGVSPTTIKTHVAQAISAVGALNRTDAAMKASALGLI